MSAIKGSWRPFPTTTWNLLRLNSLSGSPSPPWSTRSMSSSSSLWWNATATPSSWIWGEWCQWKGSIVYTSGAQGGISSGNRNFVGYVLTRGVVLFLGVTYEVTSVQASLLSMVQVYWCCFFFFFSTVVKRKLLSVSTSPSTFCWHVPWPVMIILVFLFQFNEFFCNR